MADWDSMVLVGRVGRTHGIRGQVAVTPDTDFVAERFRRGAQVWIRHAEQTTALTIVEAKLEGRRPVLAFEGYDSIEAAETLAGAELRVPESSLQPLPEGTYYLHQLVGCRVETVDGATVGDVTRVDGGAAAAVLMVASAHGDVLVPLAQEICVGIDVGARLIRVRMPEGLLELNETKAPRSRPAKPRKGKSRRAERGKEIL
ncbi:MAG TPA: ribosome maturation factor RimM [Vicinamibacterales bacterium]|jgi:16S rRNA processing protein RimM|nr:ribosome maturation factor RimM [Vicinamibacterales bacterium]